MEKRIKRASKYLIIKMKYDKLDDKYTQLLKRYFALFDTTCSELWIDDIKLMDMVNKKLWRKKKK